MALLVFYNLKHNPFVLPSCFGWLYKIPLTLRYFFVVIPKSNMLHKQQWSSSILLIPPSTYEGLNFRRIKLAANWADHLSRNAACRFFLSVSKDGTLDWTNESHKSWYFCILQHSFHRLLLGMNTTLRWSVFQVRTAISSRVTSHSLMCTQLWCWIRPTLYLPAPPFLCLSNKTPLF